MYAGDASAGRLCGRRMQHGNQSAFRAGIQGNGDIRVVPKPAATQSIPPLLLDLDGTLVDSVYERVMAWREALEESEIRLPNWKIHRRIGMTGKLFLPTLLRALGQKTTKAEIQSIEKIRASIFRKMIPEIRMQPGAKELLQFFDQRTLGHRHQRRALASRPTPQRLRHSCPSARHHRRRSAHRQAGTRCVRHRCATPRRLAVRLHRNRR